MKRTLTAGGCVSEGSKLCEGSLMTGTYWLLLVGCRSMLTSNREEPPYFSNSIQTALMSAIVLYSLKMPLDIVGDLINFNRIRITPEAGKDNIIPLGLGEKNSKNKLK
jgi:hypothetical protein